MLIPQTKKPVPRINACNVSETKERPSISPKPSSFATSSLKASQKRPPSEPLEHLPVVKIRLQQRLSPVNNLFVEVKQEPRDELSNSTDNFSNNTETLEENSNISNLFGQELSINEEVNEEEIFSDDNSDFENEDTENENSQDLAASSEANEDSDDQAELAPSDFLVQEQSVSDDELIEKKEKCTNREDNEKLMKQGKT